jgi:plasmid stabilization system protein ParE
MAVETPGVIQMSGYLLRNRTVARVRYGIAVPIETGTGLLVCDEIQTRLCVTCENAGFRRVGEFHSRASVRRKGSSANPAMAFKILTHEGALADLEEIFEWSRDKHPETTEQFANDLFEHIELLQAHPYIGTPIKGHPQLRRLLHSPLYVYSRPG